MVFTKAGGSAFSNRGKDRHACGLLATQHRNTAHSEVPYMQDSYCHPHFEPGRRTYMSQSSLGGLPSFTPCMLGSRSRTLQSRVLRSVGSGKWKLYLHPGPEQCPCYLSSTGGEAVHLGSVTACCCCCSMATSSNRINGISHSRRSH